MISRLSAEQNAAQANENQSQVPKAFASGQREAMASQFHSLSPTQGDQLSESTSSSSLSNTDSDSLRSVARQRPQTVLNISSSTTTSNNNNNNNNLSKLAPCKSPVLIKYNYYDYNGARQEQANHDMNYQVSAKVQRNLSPTFKQNLDHIVRNSQQQLEVQAAAQAQKRSPPRSPEYQQQLIMHLARRYKLSSYEQRCLRCDKTVYQMDKVGPLKDFTFYHQNCFKCRACGTKLTLKTYFNNQQVSGDHEVYCHRHCPKTGPGRLDNQSVGIRAALNAPKVFEVVSSAAHLQIAPDSGDPAALAGGQRQQQQQQPPQESPNVDSRALHIQHAVQQTRLQNIYKQSQVDKKISQFINRRLEFLEPKQKMLEMRHREEEDALFKTFEMKWRQEESSISDQIRDEWQVELSKLLDKYKRQLSTISANHHQLHQRQLPADQAKRPPSLLKQLSDGEPKGAELSKQHMIEFERMNLEKTMTIKLDRKKETLKRKLKEFERQATAELVEKQSREMLALISIKLDEFKEEQKRKIGSDLEQFEAIESLANQLGSSIQLTAAVGSKLAAAQNLKGAASAANGLQLRGPSAGQFQAEQVEAPAPKPPLVSKMELYNNEEPDEVFRDIDQLAINVAREDQQSFTDLVHHLTRHCLTDVEKVRAIFRWITVKNLNTMQFDSSVKPDTPLGLLRGIKNGSESYHVLFKRLCSYAGLHCVVIKGYSKSAGYQPGVKFEGNRFRNSWNAVYVAGAWRFVQCNWGARHLVSVAVMQDKSQPNVKKPSNGAEASLVAPITKLQSAAHAAPAINAGRSQQHHRLASPNHGRRGLAVSGSAANGAQYEANNNNLDQYYPLSPTSRYLSPKASPPSSSSSTLSYSTSSSSSPKSSALCSQHYHSSRNHQSSPNNNNNNNNNSHTRDNTQQVSTSVKNSNDSLRYEYDDHYFLTDPDEFIYEFYPLVSEWQLIKTRPITLAEFEQLPFVRSLFFKYGLYFPQHDIRSVLHTDSSGATTIKIGMPTHMIPSLIFHYNLKYYHSDLEHYEGVSLKRFVMQSVESGANDNSNGQVLLSNIVTFRVHLPENGSYILDIFANSTTPTQYITGEPMKFKSVCKFKIIAKNLKTCMIPLPDCASGEYGPMKATRLFGIIPITHESGLIGVQNDKRFLEIQFRMTRPLLDFMASLHKNGYDERQLSKSIKIFIDGDIVFVTVKFFEDGQYGLDIYTRDHNNGSSTSQQNEQSSTNKSERNLNPSPQNPAESKKQLLTHCCKYLINVRTPNIR